MTYPAPEYLEDDEWFGPATLSEKQLTIKEMREKLIEEEILLPLSEDQPRKEVANIHEVMYNISTSKGKTTTQLDPMPQLGGGSEHIQSGPGGWLSGTGMAQFK